MIIRKYGRAALFCLWGVLCGCPAAVHAQNAISTGTRAGFRMFYPGGHDWWLDPSKGNFDIRMDGGAAPLATINALGNLGINKPNPVTAIDILGTASAPPTIQLQTINTTNPGVNLFNSAGALKFSYGYSPGQDIGFIGYGGNAHLAINNNGSVGIGTANPGNEPVPAKLDVHGNGYIYATNDADGNAAVALSRSGGPAGTWNSPGGSWAMYRYGSAGGDRFAIGLAGVSEPFDILTNGNVGIGTTSPGNLLTLRAAGGAQLRLEDSSPGRTFLFGSGLGAANRFAVQDQTAGSADRFVIDSIGNVAFPTTYGKISFDSSLRYVQGTRSGADYLTIAEHSFAAGIQLGFSDATNPGGGYPFNPIMTIIGNGSNGATGSVGIGALSPAETLDVAGNIKTSGVIKLDPGAGGNPQIRLQQGGALKGFITYYNSTGDINIQQSGNGVGGINIANGDLVGIGTTNPGVALDVNGTVRATTFSGNGSGLTGIAGSINVPTRTIITASGCTPSANCSGASYTAPANVRQLKIRMVGGGGAGGCAYSCTTPGTSATATAFNGVSANPGANAPPTPTASGAIAGGAGGSGGGGTASFRSPGQGGAASGWNTGGIGGSSVLGGGAVGYSSTGGYHDGISAAANSGGGGSGASSASNAGAGGGGGGGEYVELIINSPSGSYSYSVGAGGVGAQNGGGGAGGNGGAGVIIIDESY